MAEFTNRAFNYAMLERGPVQLNIPRDHFYGDVVTKIPAPANTERSAGGPAALKVKHFKVEIQRFGFIFEAIYSLRNGLNVFQPRFILILKGYILADSGFFF